MCCHSHKERVNDFTMRISMTIVVYCYLWSQFSRVHLQSPIEHYMIKHLLRFVDELGHEHSVFAFMKCVSNVLLSNTH